MTTQANANEILMNPVRMRIIQCMTAHETATSAELAAWLSDVPRATLYRHINVLAENDYLTIVNRTRIRGATERTISLNASKLAAHAGQDSSQKAFAILMGLYRDFDAYFSSGKANPMRDFVFLKTDELHLTGAEYNAFIVEMLELIRKYSGRTASDDRPLRRFSLISSPTPDTVPND